jgi:periplasmic divalent cation tolerance protein
LPGAAILVFTQMPDRVSALALARSLVESRIAACVSVGAPVESLYHWQGKIETAEETPLVVKTRQSRYREVENAIRAQHPYELPEIVAVPVVDGLAPYLEWIADETADTDN